VPFGPWELLIILLFVILFFGARKLPEMGRALGFGMREFKEGVSGRSGDDELEEGVRPATAADRAADEPSVPRRKARASG